jgi:hypothetical protein
MHRDQTTSHWRIEQYIEDTEVCAAFESVSCLFGCKLLNVSPPPLQICSTSLSPSIFFSSDQSIIMSSELSMNELFCTNETLCVYGLQ